MTLKYITPDLLYTLFIKTLGYGHYVPVTNNL